MVGVNVHVQWNDAELRKMLKGGIRNGPQVVAQALVGEGQLMLRDAANLAPWRSRTLIKSATMLPPSVIGDRIVVRFGFGGAASKYALIQHDADWARKKRKSGRQWHYLSDPVKTRSASMGPRVVSRMARLLKAGGS